MYFFSYSQMMYLKVDVKNPMTIIKFWVTIILFLLLFYNKTFLLQRRQETRIKLQNCLKARARVKAQLSVILMMLNFTFVTKLTWKINLSLFIKKKLKKELLKCPEKLSFFCYKMFIVVHNFLHKTLTWKNSTKGNLSITKEMHKICIFFWKTFYFES